VRPRLALNALALRPDGAGVSTYIRELLRELPKALDAHLVVTVQADAVKELPALVEPDPRPVAAGTRRALLGLRVPDSVQLVHGLDATRPVGHHTPNVVSVHDLAVIDVPWAFSRRRVIGKRLQLRHAVRGADAVLAASSFTAERLRHHFRREAVVVPYAAPSDCVPASWKAVEALRRRYRLPERFVLHVGTVEPRKDVPALAAACRRVGVPLVLAGARWPGDRETPGARSLGFVPRRELNALYGAATLVAYPSRYEGFGLPPLEAMACGTPVIATATASLPEVLGDAAAFVPPSDVDALCGCVRTLVHDADARGALSRAGFERSRDFTWARTAALTGEVYRSLGVVL
jgi:glycosyltransferase involved in cell wall biosynthesis